MWNRNALENRRTIHNRNRIVNKETLFIVTLVSMFLMGATIVSNPESIFAQHHGAPPPMATLGDRNIAMNLTIEPEEITSDQDAQLILQLTDENTGQMIQHVTYRLTISNDVQTKLSEFFHSHEGDLTILVRNGKLPQVNVGGTFDVLTNAIVPDPAGKIVVSGPLFSEEGKYDIDVEVTTLDNDKTDLQVPLAYHFVTNSSSSSIGSN
ncbi:hypothetical protein [Candidatus Nitrosocosmicus franklandus]|uniref:Uncharacterized protein n=1 Tax=Candidatus Nitrosocosmicus franklandianus TaxID=1798806 RepID=A0A484IGI8_9ARCH|nr:hypothetical protein [Candidatus Nitrosocosmicus franklandus]VFJ15122.1 conserved protein of unknown function [Candidatus Nitrosocosmicus franklandus]